MTPFETDGPPWAYFEVKTGDTLVRRAYRTLRTTTPELMEDNLAKLRLEVSKNDLNFIIWRRRYTSPEQPYCRVITALPLTDAFWKSIGWDDSGTGYFAP